MPKNIVICSDGTGNTAIKGRGTNVFKLYEAVDLEGHKTNRALTRQIAFYDDGVGTGRLRVWRLLSGALGWGLSRNVRQLYADLARTYDPGDQIFLFGFSRGAFTVRTLAGFMATCGIVDRARCPTDDDLRRAVREAYRAYRDRYQTALGRFLRWIFRRGAVPAVPARVTAVRERHAVRHAGAAEEWQVPIHFVGVWDTVDAVGLPTAWLADLINWTVYRFKFPDRRLSPLVRRARHALAIDDERQTFHPVLWDETGEPPGRIEQVWFAGVHSNVGGGYPKQGMSLVALVWMMEEAEAAGLRFSTLDRQLYHERQNVYDKRYDSRAGLAFFYRYKPRDIGGMCSKHGIKTPRIHTSAIERVVQGSEGYAPGNIPGTSLVVGQPDPAVNVTRVVQRMAQALGGVRSPLDWVRWEVSVRRASQDAVIALAVLVLLMALWSGVSAKGPRALLALGSVSGALELLGTFVVEAVRGAVWWALALFVAMALAYAIGWLASRGMRWVFSGFWSRVVR